MFVVYFDQLLGAVRRQKLVEAFFSAVVKPFWSFQSFFSDFTAKININFCWKRLKKSISPAFGCAQHPKAGGNTQQMFLVLTKIIVLVSKMVLVSWRGELPLVHWYIISFRISGSPVPTSIKTKNLLNQKWCGIFEI